MSTEQQTIPEKNDEIPPPRIHDGFVLLLRMIELLAGEDDHVTLVPGPTLYTIRQIADHSFGESLGDDE